MRPLALARSASVAIVVAATGCAGSLEAPAAPGEHDARVDPAEPRAELRLNVDLEPAQGCEEAFDLALYQDRAIDLVAWDDQRGACAGRNVTIRYLSRLRREAEVLARARSLARRADPAPAPPETPR